MPAHLIAEEGPLQGLVLPLEQGNSWILGRSQEEADLIVNDGAVSRKHAKLERTSDGIVISNLSRVNPILLNGEELKETSLLKEGDHLLIGETLFLFSLQEIPEREQTYEDVFKEFESKRDNRSEDSLEEAVRSIDEGTGEKEDGLSYDTIFEEATGEHDLSFHLPPNETPFLLKVISGPNAGAEIGIEKGHSYTLGKDSACDIIFQDLSVSRMHARLEVSDSGVLQIEDLQSKNGTAVNGIVIAEKQTITPQDLVAIGTTIFLVIDREAPQETLYSPLSTPIKEEKEVAPLQPLPEKDWKKEPLPPKYLVLGGAIVAIFLVAFFSFFSLFKSKTVEIVHKDPVEEIREALSSSRFSDVQFSFNPTSGKLFLVGHVLNSVDYQEMRHHLSQIPFILDVEDTVVIDEGVSKIMNDLFSSNSLWKGITVRTIAPGKFIVSGFLQTAAEKSQLNEFLILNFPYQDRLENRVAVDETLNTEIESLLLSQGFGAVSFQLNQGSIVLSGVYDHRHEKQFKELLEQIKKLGPITSVQNFAIATSSKLAAINLSGQYAVSGASFTQGKGFNVVLNGKIYEIGDLFQGMEITNIDLHTILLEKDGVKYKIDYVPQ